jgi:Mrp family chromosome partitioning ATPase
MATEQSVREALRGVKDPELGRSLIDLGMVRQVEVVDGRVAITLALTTLACPLKGKIEGDVRQAVVALPGVSAVDVKLVAMTAQERGAAFGRDPGAGEDEPPAKQMNQIGEVVAVMSGKGGVGKSLVTGLLATSLARAGKRVGILDADITGPSIPRMFGVQGRPGTSPWGILPRRSGLGVSIMSINLLLEREDDAVIWRGPMIGNVIKQFWEEVLWGKLDYLLVDLPPGTSDAPLTVMQSLPVAGAVVVSSPQDLASMVVRKAVRMLGAMNVPVLGVVENMSYFVAPDTGVSYEIFGPSRAEELATVAGAPLLGRLPIDPALSALCDSGRLEEYQSDAYTALAQAFATVGPASGARSAAGAR